MNPILIGGCGSSGTTLLRVLLNAHPKIHCGTELNLFNNKIFYDEAFSYSRFDFKDLLSNRLVLFKYSLLQYGYYFDDICKIAEDCNSFKTFVEQIIQSTLRKNKKSIWIEKSPSNCRYLKSFKDIFPDGKYIHVVRDGRDVVMSLVKRGWTPENAIRRWLYDTMCGVPLRGDKKYMEVKYEDLVTNPSVILRNLHQFLDVEIIDFDSLEVSNEFSGEYKKTWIFSPINNISDQGISKWHKMELRSRRKMERLFKFIYLSKKVQDELKMDSEINGNYALKLFGYDYEYKWNCNRTIDLNVIYLWIRSLISNMIKIKSSAWTLKIM